MILTVALAYRRSGEWVRCCWPLHCARLQDVEELCKSVFLSRNELNAYIPAASSFKKLAVIRIGRLILLMYHWWTHHVVIKQISPLHVIKEHPRFVVGSICPIFLYHRSLTSGFPPQKKSHPTKVANFHWIIWKKLWLGGGFKYFLLSPLLGELNQFD